MKIQPMHLLLIVVLLSSSGCVITDEYSKTHQQEVRREQQFLMIRTLYDDQSNLMVRENISLRQIIETSDREMKRLVSANLKLSEDLHKLNLLNNIQKVELIDLKSCVVHIRPRKLKEFHNVRN